MAENRQGELAGIEKNKAFPSVEGKALWLSVGSDLVLRSQFKRPVGRELGRSILVVEQELFGVDEGPENVFPSDLLVGLVLL